MIITTQRHPFNCWLDRLLTLAGWFVFSYLLAHGLWLLLQHSMNTVGFEQMDPIFPTLTTFLLYGLVLGVNALLLFGWSRWQRHVMRRHELQHNGLCPQRLHAKQEPTAPSLRFTDEHIDTVRNSQVVVLYHSQDGAVEDVKATVSNRPTSNSLVLVPALPGFSRSA